MSNIEIARHMGRTGIGPKSVYTWSERIAVIAKNRTGEILGFDTAKNGLSEGELARARCEVGVLGGRG